jgi:Fe-S cluster biogenesis protein NfuA/nitrite reductase/ring-hydroxylating ferredoxin subunit
MADLGPVDRLRVTGERIDALLDASGSTGDPRAAVARERAEELVRLTADLYGAGLERLLDILYDAGRLDDAALAALAADELVAGLLLVHGLHPYDVTLRVEQALEAVRPYLGSHGGDVELLEVTDDGTVRLRLLGSCDGCPSSAVTLKLAVEGAIEAAAPEVTAIEVEEAAAEPRAAGVIPVASLRSRLDRAADGPAVAWQPLPQLADLPSGAVTTVEVAASSVLVARLGSELFAYLDRCAVCDGSLQGAVLARRLGAAVGEAVLRCPSCRAHYDVRRAGACLDDATRHLTPVPLLTDGGISSVAVAATVPA